MEVRFIYRDKEVIYEMESNIITSSIKHEIPEFLNVIGVVIGDGIVGIETNAFANWFNLETVELPASCEYISDHAFERTKIHKLNAKYVKELGHGVFNMTPLHSLSLSKDCKICSDTLYGTRGKDINIIRIVNELEINIK